ncbi:YutD family protein, partial [Peribacillus frigoritolerans]
MININNMTYEIIEDEREGYNEEAFKARYSEILTKYDYIVGDWGYGQLRLRGFFDDSNQKATFDT